MWKTVLVTVILYTGVMVVSALGVKATLEPTLLNFGITTVSAIIVGGGGILLLHSEWFRR